MRELGLLLAMFILFPSYCSAMDKWLPVAIEQFNRLTTYRVTMRSYGPSEQVIRYRYKKPGYVRIDFVKPHEGATLVYRPDTGKVELRPFAFASFLTFTLSPDDGLVHSPSGHRVDQSDLGALLRRALQLAVKGSSNVLREEIVHKRAAVVLEIDGGAHVSDDGVGRYLLWMDKELRLPVIVESYDIENRLIEGLFLDNLEMNPELGDVFRLSK